MEFRGQDVAALDRAARRDAALKVQMIFQDPTGSLNPRMRVGDIVGEAPLVHGIVAKAEVDGYVDALLARVGLDPGYRAATRTSSPAASGSASASRGRWRSSRSSSSATNRSPRSTSRSRRRCSTCSCGCGAELGLTYLFISHDLGVVEHISDRVVIMYLGRVVEIAPTEELFARPNHPYTQALLANVPRLDANKQRFAPIKGEIPSPLDPPPGCHFHPRCPHAMARCRVEPPALTNRRIFVFDVHIEFADVRREEIHDRAVIGKRAAREHHLIRAFLIELAQPRASFVWVHGRLRSTQTDQCSLLFQLSRGATGRLTNARNFRTAADVSPRRVAR